MNDSLIAVAIIAIPSAVLVINNVKRELAAVWFVLASMVLLLIDYTGINSTVGAFILLVVAFVPFFLFSWLALVSIWDNKEKIIKSLAILLPLFKLLAIAVGHIMPVVAYLLANSKEEKEPTDAELAAEYNEKLGNHQGGVADVRLQSTVPNDPALDVARKV